jgi:hypothetical protein
LADSVVSLVASSVAVVLAAVAMVSALAWSPAAIAALASSSLACRVATAVALVDLASVQTELVSSAAAVVVEADGLGVAGFWAHAAAPPMVAAAIAAMIMSLRMSSESPRPGVGAGVETSGARKHRL